MVNLFAAVVLVLASALLMVALAALALVVIAVVHIGPWRPRPAPRVLPQPRGRTVGEYVSQLGGHGTTLRSRPISDL